MFDLGFKGKVAIVTGAGSQIGFGRAIAVTLADNGCDVAVMDIKQDEAEMTVSQIKSLGRKAIALKVDLTKNAEVVNAVDSVFKEFGKVDILVNNAGATTKPASFLESDEEEWDFNLNINLKAHLYVTKAVLPKMVERKYGKIVNVTSGVGQRGMRNCALYSAAKAGMIIFSQALAGETAAMGINVNCVNPAWADTGFSRSTMFDGKAPGPEALQRFAEGTPIGRITDPQDIANTVVFLASDVSSYITGDTIQVNGGRGL
jgi:NAD(P)-dependent dehydrogenase (short-subunit alcohol dehydrogenase family)